MISASLFCTHCGAANQAQVAFCYACGQPIQVPGNGQAGHAGPLNVGELLKQRYFITQQIGSGGFGAVYKAEDKDLGKRLVAVKEMSQHNLSPQEVIEASEAFKQEALMLADLMHEHLPRIYDQFSENGRWYLVMDYIRGETLEEYLSRTPGAHLGLDEALDIGLQLCSVLNYLHTRQPPIIFRDLKPSNVIITPDHRIFLVDFGIARHFKPGQARDTVAFGSPGYAPPEQYGKAQTTPRADIYSLGAILHQMLSGDDPSLSPFRFSPLNFQAPALQQILISMLNLDESKRPGDMMQVKQELQRIKDRPQSQPVHTTSIVQPAPIPQVIRPSAGSGLLIYEGHASAVRVAGWSPNSIYVASASSEIIRVWDMQNGREICTYQGHPVEIMDMAWVPRSMRIASLSRDNDLHIWDGNNGQLINAFALPSDAAKKLLAWSPDAGSLALVGTGKTIEVVDALQGKQIYAWKRPDHCTTLIWAPYGERLAMSDGNNIVTILKVGRQRAELTYEHSSQINAMAWSPDGIYIASGGRGQLINVWFANTKELLGLYATDPPEPISALAWSPDSQMLASGSLMGTLQIWRARTKEKIATYNGHTGGILSLAWSPNGRYLVSGSSDKTVRVWHAPSLLF